VHVAICIVGYRNPSDVHECIRALQDSTYTDFEIVICENGGASAYQALKRQLPTALTGGQRVSVYCSDRNLGYAGGVNRCLQESARADVWWVLNPDTLPQPEAMAHQVERLEQGDCDATGCVLVHPHGSVQSFGGRWQPILSRAVSIGHGAASEAGVSARKIEERQNYLNGASMMVTRAFVEQAGFMKEDYFLYCEEVEWCLRALRRGMRLGFALDAKVVHRQGTTTGNGVDFRDKSRLSIYLIERNRILLTRDVYGGMWLASLGMATLQLSRYVKRRAWRQLVFAIQGLAAGAMNQRGPPSWADV
jgi:GT2 family glycosyltransferase